MFVAIQVLLIEIDALKYGNLFELNTQRKVMAFLSFAIGMLNCGGAHTIDMDFGGMRFIGVNCLVNLGTE